MKNITLGHLQEDRRKAFKIPILDFASQGNAILGIRDSGKTYTATYLAEQLLKARIPFVAFDPIGVWKYLRVPGKGAGHKVVVAGGRNGDLPLTPQSAPEIVRAAMRGNVPLVIDLYSMNLSKADWRRIVETSVRVLLYENEDYGLRHIFIEEAAEFVPQVISKSGGGGKVYAEIEKLARMGGNAKLGYTLINQRGEQVNKAVLELCDCLFLHRQKGRLSITALNKWLDVGAVGQSKEIAQSLPLLTLGDCWVWTAGSNEPMRIQVPEKQSFHPDRRALLQKSGPGKFKAQDVSSFVSQLSESLKEHLEEAEKNNPKKLRAAIARLRRELKQAQKEVKVEQVVETVEVPYIPDDLLASLWAIERSMRDKIEPLTELVEDVSAAIQKLEDIKGKKPKPKPKPAPRRKPAAKPTPPKRKPAVEPQPDEPLPIGEKKILIACGMYPDGLNRNQITVLSGYKRSSRDAYINRLQKKGLVESASGKVHITDAGVGALGDDYEPLPTGGDLQNYWLEKLPAGEKVLLQILLDNYPDEVDRETMSDLSGYKRSSRDAYLNRMNAKELIEVPGAGLVRASENLFE